MGQFFTDPINKAVLGMEIVWQEYVKDDRRHSEHYPMLKKVFALAVSAQTWIAETVFDNVSTAKLPLSKNNVILSIL